MDSEHQVIVAVGVSNQPPDVEYLEPILKRIATTAGALPDVMTMDAGYWSEDNVKDCCHMGRHCRRNGGRCDWRIHGWVQAAWVDGVYLIP